MVTSSMNTADDSEEIVDKKAKYFYKRLMEIKIEKRIALQRWNIMLNHNEKIISLYRKGFSCVKIQSEEKTLS